MELSTSAMKIKPGDDVAAVVFWVPGSNTAVLGVCSWTNALCVNFNVTGVGEPSNTTEWIVEATTDTLTGTIGPLPNYGSVNFINAQWASATTLSAAAKPNNSYALSAGQAGAGITGTYTGQPIAAGPSLTEIDLYIPYSNGARSFISEPDRVNGITDGVNNSSDFTVKYWNP
jgi:hypothetical protein